MRNESKNRIPGSSGPPPTNPAILDSLRAALLRAFLSLRFAEVFADLGALRSLNGAPVVLAINHQCVYDASIAMTVCDAVGRGMWLAGAGSLVDALPPLRRLGFFAVRRGDPMATARQLKALGDSARNDVRRAIVFFPEAGHVRPGLPVTPERGALTVARAAAAPVVPMAIAYEFFERARPFVYVKAIEAVGVKRGSDVDLRTLLDRARAALSTDLLTGTGSYEPLVRRSPHTVLVGNVPLDVRRIGRSCGPLYRQLAETQTREDRYAID